MHIILALIAAFATMKFSRKYFFTDDADLLACLKYWFQPSPSRFLSAQWDGDFWRELRLFVWLLMGALSGYAVYRFLIS